MYSIIIVGPLLLIGVLWWLLERHERRRVADGKPRHSGLRVLGAAAAILTALFAGGCSLLFLGSMDGSYVTPESVAIIGGVPFVGAALWSVVALARQSSLLIKLAALAATFITAFCVLAMGSLTGALPASDPLTIGLPVAAVITGVVALWLFRTKNPVNPPGA